MCQGRQNRKNHRGSRITAMIIMAALLTGCADAQGPAPRESVHSPVDFDYVVENPLIIESFEENGENDKTQLPRIYGDYLQISGLLDKEVEKKINDRLLSVYNMYEGDKLPPYRGIKAKIEPGMLLVQKNRSMYVSYNADNVLSVQVYFNWQYGSQEDEKKGRGFAYVTCSEPCTFDLNTGEELSLSDVFCDDVDYQKEVNDFLLKEINESEARGGDEYGPLPMTAPFKGIGENQKFLLEESGRIGLIFDYRTPEFATSFSERMAEMPFSEKMAVTKRYRDDKTNIYESGAKPVKALLTALGSGDVTVKMDEAEKGGVTLTRTYSMSKTFPQEVQDSLSALANFEEPVLNEIRTSRNTAVKEGYSDVEAAYNLAVHTSRAGRFINVDAAMYAGVYAMDKDRFVNFYYKHKNSVSCYRMDGEGPLGLPDIFAAGADHMEILKKALEKEFERAHSEGLLEYDMDIEKYVSGICGKISGFSLHSRNIMLEYDDTFTIFYESLKSESERQTAAELQSDPILYLAGISVAYEALGCENLNIW